MVFDAAFLAGTAASLMMNGACCYYQSNREDELREDLREEIRREWQLQRKREMTKRQERKDLQSSEFEDRYQELMQRSSEEHMSYAEKHNIFVSRSNSGGNNSGCRLTAASVYSTDTPYPGRVRHRRGPPSVTNALLISRNSSIMEDDDDDDDDDQDDTNTNFMFVTDAGSDTASLEDVSITTGYT